MKLGSLKEAEQLAEHFLRVYPAMSCATSVEAAAVLAPFCWTVGVQARKAWINLGVDPTVEVRGKQITYHPRYHEGRPARPGAHWVVWADRFVLDVAAGIQGPHLPTPFVWEKL